MYIDAAAFGPMPVFFSRTYCLHCKTDHEWFAKDAWVCAPGPLRSARPRVNGKLHSSRRNVQSPLQPIALPFITKTA
jgi:hypothetical protein